MVFRTARSGSMMRRLWMKLYFLNRTMKKLHACLNQKVSGIFYNECQLRSCTGAIHASIRPKELPQKPLN